MVRVAGHALIVLGALLALPQIFKTDPVQILFAVGLLILIVGSVLLCDNEPTPRRRSR